MSKVIENYILNEVVGSGQYGKVYSARNMKTDKVVAIKVIKKEKFKETPKLNEFLMNEIQTLSKIENIHVVKFQEMLKTSNNMYLIYEFCNGGTLENLINQRKFLTEVDTMLYFSQILVAFKTLVKYNILHRDLKPSNILFHDGVIKIADFGFCKQMQSAIDLTQTMVGSPIYMAPEVLKGMSYTTKADIWSLGVVLYEMLFGICPYEDQSIARLITQIDNKELQIPRHINNISKRTEDLIRQMLVIDTKKRIDWSQVFVHVLGNDSENNNNSSIINVNNNSAITAMSSNNNSNSRLNLTKKLSQQNLNIQPSYYNNQGAIQPLGVNKDLLNLVSPQYQQNQVNLQQFTPQQQHVSQQPLLLITNQQQNYILMNQQMGGGGNIVEDKQKNIQNLRVLIKERNKINLMANCVATILDYNISQKTPIYAFLMAKQAQIFAEQFKKQIEQNFFGTQFEKKLENLGDFLESQEFKAFQQITNKEICLVQGMIENFKQEILKIIKTSLNFQENIHLRNEVNCSSINFKYFYNNYLGYIDEINEKINSSQEIEKDENIKKYQLHANEVLDSLMVEELFENQIEINIKYLDQKYFETLRKYSKENLNEVVQFKIEQIKKKCPQ